MSYSNFIQSIFEIIPNLINWLNTIFNSLMNNYIFLTLIFVGLFIFIFSLLLELINFINSLISTKKSKTHSNNNEVS